VTLPDVTLRCTNDYASIAVVSLDNQPIKSSGKLLVQVGTVARPTGWQDKDATWSSGDGKTTTSGKEVVSTGKILVDHRRRAYGFRRQSTITTALP
jgi:hypothetical protein